MYGIQEEGYAVGDRVVLALRNTRRMCGTALVKAISGNRILLEPIPAEELGLNPKILVVPAKPPEGWKLNFGEFATGKF